MYGIPLRPEYIFEGRLGSSQETPEQHESDILDVLIGERLRFFEQVISGLKGQIQERQALNSRLGDAVTEEWCETKARFYELDIWPMGRVRSIDQRRQAIEKELAVLEAEKRKEDVACFRDVGLIKRDLREWEKRYQDILRRAVVIGGFERHEREERVPVQP